LVCNPVSTITSCTISNRLSGWTNVRFIWKFCLLNYFVEYFFYFWSHCCKFIRKLPIERNNVLFASAMEIVNKLNFILSLGQKVSKCSSFRLRKWSWSSKILPWRTFFSLTAYSIFVSIVPI
jgi:hypothetical protein